MGGYKIIDLKDVDFTIGEAQTISGIYADIESNYRKATLFENFVLAGVEKPDRYAILHHTEDKYVGGFGYSENGDVLSIEVTSDDAVTINSTI